MEDNRTPNPGVRDVCCPTYECRPPADKCVVVDAAKNKTIVWSVGDSWQTGDACVQERCAYKYGSRWPEVRSTVEQCELLECLVAHESLSYVKGCPYCKQTACVLEGKAVRVGEVVRSSDNCTKYECTQSGGDSSGVTKTAVAATKTFAVLVAWEPCPDVSACAPRKRADVVRCVNRRHCRKKVSGNIRPHNLYSCFGNNYFSTKSTNFCSPSALRAENHRASRHHQSNF